jgi:aquaporin Z
MQASQEAPEKRREPIEHAEREREGKGPATDQERARRPVQETSDGGPLHEARSLVAELFGTFFLTTVAAGGEVIAGLSGGEVSHAARAVAPGLVVLALIYAVSDVSGAHFNPAVTLAFALRGDFAWWRVPGYWLAQGLGAVLAAVFLRALFGVVEHLGATRPHVGTGAALVMEAALTCLLVTVILGTAARNSKIGPNAALAVGSTIALCGLFAAPVSGASMNPARSLGPAIVAGELQHQWIYAVGPALGSLLAVALAWVFHTEGDPEETEAASGEKKGQRGREKQPNG